MGCFRMLHTWLSFGASCNPVFVQLLQGLLIVEVRRWGTVKPIHVLVIGQNPILHSNRHMEATTKEDGFLA